MIHFAGTSLHKADEYKRYIGDNVSFIHFECEELQNFEVEEVARNKSLNAFRNIKKPLFVDDTGLYIDCLGGLPGPFITWFISKIGSNGLADICKESRSAFLKTSISYIDSSEVTSVFSGEIYGYISTEPRGHNGFGFDDIFIPIGQSLTLSEMNDQQKRRYNPRLIAALKLKEFIQQMNL